MSGDLSESALFWRCLCLSLVKLVTECCAVDLLVFCQSSQNLWCFISTSFQTAVTQVRFGFLGFCLQPLWGPCKHEKRQSTCGHWTVFSLQRLQVSLFDFLKLKQTAWISFSSQRLPPGWCSLLPHWGLLRQTETDWGTDRQIWSRVIVWFYSWTRSPAVIVQKKRTQLLQWAFFAPGFACQAAYSLYVLINEGCWSLCTLRGNLPTPSVLLLLLLICTCLFLFIYVRLYWTSSLLKQNLLPPTFRLAPPSGRIVHRKMRETGRLWSELFALMWTNCPGFRDPVWSLYLPSLLHWCFSCWLRPWTGWTTCCPLCLLWSWTTLNLSSCTPESTCSRCLSSSTRPTAGQKQSLTICLTADTDTSTGCRCLTCRPALTTCLSVCLSLQSVE